MKILYLLFAFLFLAFLSEPGSASHKCHDAKGMCSLTECTSGTNLGQKDCAKNLRCCKRIKGK
uniref:Crotasin-like_protein n=1 Tax=Ovophis okinavensis TaxID=8769 RepID=U3TAK0_OVOOK|nr:crotasin-like_protein [Ovophis okinavensis]